MFDVTVTEAAKRLHVSRTRILQLIHGGTLDAERTGNIWLIDGKSIEARLSSRPAAGRPKTMPSKQRSGLFVLMSRDHPILSFRFDSENGTFHDTDNIHDAFRAPLGILSPRGKRVSREALAAWWNHRTIPKGRTGIEEKLAELGIAETYDLPFRSMGLSLSDQYWIKPQGADLSWSDINFFQNDFDVSEAGAWLSEVGLDSPDNTSDGMLSKTWVCRKGKRILLKGGTVLDQEPYNECVATNLHRRLLQSGEYVPYSLETWGGMTVSACPEFLAPTEEYIPALYVKEVVRQDPRRSDFRHFIECCERLGVEDAEPFLQKMIVCDDLIANTDRHWRNFGLIRDVETLECRMAPLFDSGTSLWCTVPTRDMPYAGFGFVSRPFAESPNDQLRLVNDFSWLDVDALAGFAEEAIELLDENPLLAGRTDFIFEGIQSRVDHLIAIAA